VFSPVLGMADTVLDGVQGRTFAQVKPTEHVS
jgi:hypothetical protein